MSAFLSSYLDDKLFDWLFNATSFGSAPASAYLALFTSDPTAAGSGTEVAGGTYARQAISMAASSGGVVTSDGAATFTDLPSAAITHYGVFDALSSGNLLLYGALPSTINVNSGEQVSFPIGAIDFTLTGS